MDRPIESREQWILEGVRARLAACPEASIFAVNEWGIPTDVPADFGEAHHPVLAFRAATDLGPASSIPAYAGAWAEVMAKGVSRARVELHDGSWVILTMWDVRSEHGVIIGALLPDNGDGSDVEAEDAIVLPARFGTTHRDALGTVLEADWAVCRMLGWDLERLRELETTELIHPDDRERALTHWLEMLSSPGSPRRWRGRHQRADGAYVWFEFTDTNLLDDPDHGYILSDMLDIADEMQAIESMRSRERLLDRLTEALPDGVVQIDREGAIVYQNERMGELIGVRRADTLDELLATVVSEDRDPLVARLSAAVADGSDCDVEIRADVDGRGLRVLRLLLRSLPDESGRSTGDVICVSDITEASRLRQELEDQARVDSLTGCLNRRSTIAGLAEVLESGHSTGTATTVIFVDLNRFKPVNDELGHAAGDELLTVVADRLRSAVRGHDFVGRLGGDEFLVVCPDTSRCELAGELAERLSAALERPVTIAGRTMVPTASYGIGWAVNAEVTVDELVALADAAMYEAKHAGSARPALRTVS